MNAKQGLKFLFTAIAILCLAVLCVPQIARAQNGTWSANSTNTFNWADAANWTSSTIAGNNTTTDNTGIATFVNRTGTQTVNVDSGRNVFGIDFSGNSNPYTLSGNGILLSNGGFIQTSGGGSGHTDTISSAVALQGSPGTAFFTANSSSSTRVLSISGNVTGTASTGNTTTLTLNGDNAANNLLTGVVSNGSGGGNLALAKSGAGTWVIGGNNTYSGGTTISNGIVRVDNNGAFGTGNVTLSGGTLGAHSGTGRGFANNFSFSNNLTLGVGTGALSFNGTNTLSANTTFNVISGVTGNLNGQIVESGGNRSITKTGLGTLSIGGGNNTFTGGIRIQEGVLASSSGTANGFFGATGSQIILGNPDPSSSANATLNILFIDNNNYSVIVNSSNNTSSTRTITSTIGGGVRALFADIQIGDGTGSINSLVLGGRLILSGNITQSGNNTASLLVTNAAGGDPAQLAGSSNNTFTGATTLLASTLILAKTGSAVAIQGDLNIGTLTSSLNRAVEFRGTSSQISSNSIVNFANGTAGNSTIFINSTASNTIDMAGLNSDGDRAFIGAANTSTHTHTLNLAGAGNYSFGGIIRNSFDGTTSTRTVAVTKSGNGTQAFLGLNSYTGNTTINSGVLSVSNLANGGSASGIGSSSNASTSLVLNGGTLRYTGNTTSTDRNYTIGTSGATFDASGGGALTLSGTTPTLSGTNAARTLTLTGSNTGNNTFAANLANNGNGATSLVKNGVGTWALSGASTYNGTTIVNAGTLIVSGSIASAATVNGTFSLGSGGTAAAVTVNSGGLLTGSGTVGATTIGSGGSINPGNSPGTLAFTGNLTLSSGSTSNFEIDGFTANLFDLAQQSGSQTVNFGGTLNLLFQTGFNTTGNVTIFNFGTYNGSFSAVNTSGLASGYTASFDAANGLVTVVPEPATWLLLTATLCGFLFLRRRTPQA